MGVTVVITEDTTEEVIIMTGAHEDIQEEVQEEGDSEVKTMECKITFVFTFYVTKKADCKYVQLFIQRSKIVIKENCGKVYWVRHFNLLLIMPLRLVERTGIG